MKEVSKTYCRVPFDSVTVSPTGRFQLCCEAQWTETIGTEKNKVADVDSIEDWFNSDYLNNVRQSMPTTKRVCDLLQKRKHLWYVC